MLKSILFSLKSVSASWLVEGSQTGHFLPKFVQLKCFVCLVCYSLSSVKPLTRTCSLQLATAPAFLRHKTLGSLSCSGKLPWKNTFELPQVGAWEIKAPEIWLLPSNVKKKKKKNLFIHSFPLFKYNEKSSLTLSCFGILKEWLGRYVVTLLRPS